jgi:transposase
MDVVYKVAGIDVHKKMLAVVVADVANAAELGEYRFEHRKFSTGDAGLEALADWLLAEGVLEAVMESTAQYWKPVWRTLEQKCKLHLAQAQSNRAPKGRKSDFADAERLVRRFVAGELILSFVPEAEHRLWRMMTRTRYQLTRERVRLRHYVEGFLEDCQLKLSSHLSDLFGLSGRKMLRALADGATDPAMIAALADGGIRARQEDLTDALGAAATLDEARRQMLKLILERLELLDQQRDKLARLAASALSEHQDAVRRLCNVPGLAADSAQQIIAEVGPKAATFPTPESLASWVGCCPGREESAEVSKSDKSPKGNPTMRRLLSQCANAAIKSKGSVFYETYRRLVPRLGHGKALWAVAHKLCRITWKILHDSVEYEERGQQPDQKSVERRVHKLTRQLRALGYQVQLQPTKIEA